MCAEIPMLSRFDFIGSCIAMFKNCWAIHWWRCLCRLLSIPHVWLCGYDMWILLVSYGGWLQQMPPFPANSCSQLKSKWVFSKIGVSPNHPFLIGFSIINHPFWGTPIFGNTQMEMISNDLYIICKPTWHPRCLPVFNSYPPWVPNAKFAPENRPGLKIGKADRIPTIHSGAIWC